MGEGRGEGKMISYYDAHNHLQDERLATSLDSILNELPRAGVKACVVNGTSEKDWPQVAALAKTHHWIIPAFGLHPWFVAARSPRWFDALRGFLDANPRACVGEIGLDRWMENPNLPDQEEVFTRQLSLAAERNVAAAIHCLKAWGPLEAALKNNPRPTRGFLIHSYGGSAEMIPAFAKLGAYFSISGYFAHERKSAQREVFKQIPIDRLLVETDAPNMAPPPEMGTGPATIASIYQFAAKLRDMPLESFATQIEENFRRLY